jgi:glycosyltransferase involved in cell wall biosynthesis
MESSPLISVIIPTYNREGLVVQAVRSVLEQRYRHVELHLVDDGSQDNTKAALEPYFPDPRFHYHYQTNLGQSAARNAGIARASGEYIAFLDSDNYWLPDKLSKQVSFMAANPGYDILYSNIYVTGPDNQLRPSKTRRYSGRILDKLIAGNFITNNTALVKKGCFVEAGGFDTGLRQAEDYDLWLRFALRYRFLYQPEPLACYNVDGDRVSSDEPAVVAANFRILKRFFDLNPDAVSNALRNEAWSRLYRWRAQATLRQGSGSPWEDIVRAMALTPFASRNWKVFARMVAARTTRRPIA